MAILSYIALSIVASAVHELGHLLMGLAVGFKFHMLVVGPFGLKRNENDKVKFYLEKDLSLWGGIGAALPTNDDDSNYEKFGHVLLAGPAASILFGSICLPLGIHFDQMLLILLGTMPIAMGLVCLVPFRNGAFYTDGGRWLRMFKNEKTRAVEIATWRMTQKAIVTGNCAELDTKDIALLTNDEDSRTQYLGHYYAYHLHNDKHNHEGAENAKKSLSDLKTKVPKQMVTMFQLK